MLVAWLLSEFSVRVCRPRNLLKCLLPTRLRGSILTARPRVYINRPSTGEDKGRQCVGWTSLHARSLWQAYWWKTRTVAADLFIAQILTIESEASRRSLDRTISFQIVDILCCDTFSRDSKQRSIYINRRTRSSKYKHELKFKNKGTRTFFHFRRLYFHPLKKQNILKMIQG